MQECLNLFMAKASDYGTSWRVMRLQSLLDQILIKAKRIRTIQETGVQYVSDSIESEYVGIINYNIICLIQLELGASLDGEIDTTTLAALYWKYATVANDTMVLKNHDYGEAWRDMRHESFIDMILARLLRIRRIIDNEGKLLASEGIENNLIDMINYSVFALLRMREGGETGAEYPAGA